MAKNNIPLSELDDENFTFIFKNFFNINIYSSKHYRETLLPNFYKEKIIEIYEHFHEKIFYWQFHETPDSQPRKFLNILIGELDEKEFYKYFLINTTELEDVNYETVTNEIFWLIPKIIKSPLLKSNFKLLVSDKASYAVLLRKKHSNQIRFMLHIYATDKIILAIM